MYTIRQGERTDYNYKEIFCDTQNDFDTLNLNSAEFQKICAGSVAYVIETSNVYILNSKGEWVAQSSGGGGGGGDIHNQDKTITENGSYTADAGYTGLGTVTVDVPSGSEHDWSAIGYSGEPQEIQDGYDYAKTIYDNWDSSITSMNNMFANSRQLDYMPLVDTSNVTDMSSAFESSSIRTIPQLDTSNVTNIGHMFSNCTSLTTIPLLSTSSVTDFRGMFHNCSSLIAIPQINTTNGTNMNGMFRECTSLTTVPQLDTSNVTIMFNMFWKCTSLTTVPQLDTSNVIDVTTMFKNCASLTTFGGLKNLGEAYLTTQSANHSNYKLDLSSCTLLSHDSLMNVINNLYDIATAGVQTQKLVLGATNLAKLTAEEIAIATNKGWTVS